MGAGLILTSLAFTQTMDTSDNVMHNKMPMLSVIRLLNAGGRLNPGMSRLMGEYFYGSLAARALSSDYWWLEGHNGEGDCPPRGERESCEGNI